MKNRKFKVDLEIDFEFIGKVTKSDRMNNIICAFFDHLPYLLDSVTYNGTSDFHLVMRGLSWKLQPKESTSVNTTSKS